MERRSPGPFQAKSRWSVGVLLVVTVLAALGLGSRQLPLGSRKIASPEGYQMIITLPMAAGFIMESAAMRAASGARVPLGFERIEDDRLRVRPTRGSEQRVDLVGQPLGQVLDQLTREAPKLVRAVVPDDYRFTWREEDGTISVSPVRGHQSFLDTVIPSLDLKDTTLPPAATALHRFFESQYPDRSRAADELPRTWLGTLEKFLEKQAIFKRTFSITLTNVTVRQALNALVKAHGEVSWSVTFSDDTLGYQDCNIRFEAFNGASLSFGAKLPPKRWEPKHHVLTYTVGQ